MEQLTTFTRKSRIFQNRNYFFFMRSIRLSTVTISHRIRAVLAISKLSLLPFQEKTYAPASRMKFLMVGAPLPIHIKINVDTSEMYSIQNLGI